MKQLLAHINHKCIRTAFLLFTVAILSTQSVSTALAVSVQNSSLANAIRAELDRRTTVIAADKTLAQTTGTSGVSTALVSFLNTVQHSLDTRRQSVNSATTDDQLNSVSTDVDNDYAAYHAADQATKLYSDLKAQDNSLQNLRNLAQEIRDIVNAAKANGATHVNAGVAGFVNLDLINQSIDKLQKSMSSAAIITVALNSMMSLLSSDGGFADSATSATFTQMYTQLSSTEDALSNVSLGLSQLSNITTGNRTGISYCGWWNNCRGMENNGAIQTCGLASNCSDSKNTGTDQSCGILSNCSNSTNNGTTQSCGLASNCSDSSNTGLNQNCGIFSNCSNSTNTGLFVNCGAFSVCAGSTNQGVTQICGILSYCANSQNNGLNQNCGGASNCQNNINNGIAQECGILSNCSNSQNTGVVQNCGGASNCASSVNNGVAITCGTLSNCSNSINNGVVVQCGAASNCSGATNNGLLMICGVLSNCRGSKTDVFVSICGAASDCSGGTTHSFITICGTLSNCSSTISACNLNSDGLPITTSYEAPSLPYRVWSASA
jgi:hypothetical protein